MKRLPIVLCTWTIAICGYGQWNVPTGVVLDGSDAAQRKVTGLASPTSNDAGASMITDRSGGASLGIAEGLDLLITALDPPLDAYRPGLRITLVPMESNSGDAAVNVNGLGSVPIRKNVDEPLDSADLQAGIPADLVFDGAVFQLTDQVHPACPSGFIAIGREACVERVSHDAVNWYGSSYYCGQRGFRLCSFAEFIQACRMPGGILGSIVDYEWVDEAANHANYAKMMGNSDILGIDCRAGSLRTPLATARYRCCSER